MGLPNLGINNDSINYEVALESIGARAHRYVNAQHKEEQKEHPSAALIEYCKQRISAFDDLREALDPSDKEVIERLLTGDNFF
ncbi:hypothetical protein AGMMS50229_04470 [Campylobacterota bacterium]|nr:hypothetical protein AGMMS50229_04470 [Campylobacterota bacterium]